MPTLVNVPRWRAFDGQEFETEEAAEAHEAANFAALLCGLSREQVEAALERKPEAVALADAIEKAGGIIARKRREAGELRFTRGKSANTAPAQDERAPEIGPENAPETETEREEAL